MATLYEIWAKDKSAFDGKSLINILGFAGALRDNNQTSNEFRELLAQVPSSLLKQYAEDCLSGAKFQDSGLALQDIINEVGKRLGFGVKAGLYQGRSNQIGFDGIWKSPTGHSIVVEVKTTDAFSINLDDIAEYRSRLIAQNEIEEEQSSILIVVGRQDTGGLEAQVRGSRHAWDIRLISTGSFLRLLDLKENLNDQRTIQQINELLKPREFTRIDELINLIFLTTQDIQTEESIVDEGVGMVEGTTTEPKEKGERATPVNFHNECIRRIEEKLRVNLVKQTRIAYANTEKTLGVVCAISKTYMQGQVDNYWFAFHPHQQEFLKDFEESYVAYGCGSPETIFLIPFNEFAPILQTLHTTKLADRMYWHVTIWNKSGQYIIKEALTGSTFDVTKYRI